MMLAMAPAPISRSTKPRRAPVSGRAVTSGCWTILALPTAKPCLRSRGLDGRVRPGGRPGDEGERLDRVDPPIIERPAGDRTREIGAIRLEQALHIRHGGEAA